MLAVRALSASAVVQSRLRIQLWSYNYDPEPMGIGPVSTVWARGMQARGHDVEVIAAHPHYPAALWGRRLLPYREQREGIRVRRLPLWTGRDTPAERVRQEASYAAALTAALPSLATPDVIVAVSPCFPALLPAIANARLRRVPWILWLQDILPDGALTTDLLEPGAMVKAARMLERAAYRSASRIAVLSEDFKGNLQNKGVRSEKVACIYNPATCGIRQPRSSVEIDRATVFTMGNVGRSQGLGPIVAGFEASHELRQLGARLFIAGQGIAAPAVRAQIRTDRVVMTGLLSGDQLERRLDRTTVGLVSQAPGQTAFNVPSKLMNFMAYGIPVVASVSPQSEAARIINASGAGWVADSADPRHFNAMLGDALMCPEQLQARGRAGLDSRAVISVPQDSLTALNISSKRLCCDLYADGAGDRCASSAVRPGAIAPFGASGAAGSSPRSGSGAPIDTLVYHGCARTTVRPSARYSARHECTRDTRRARYGTRLAAADTDLPCSIARNLVETPQTNPLPRWAGPRSRHGKHSLRSLAFQTSGTTL